MKQPRPSDLPDEETVREHPTPQWWMTDEEVEDLEFDYSDRAPTDFVISGTLGDARGPGRNFRSWGAAEKWAREFYGTRFKGRIAEADTEESTRWCFLVAAKR